LKTKAAAHWGWMREIAWGLVNKTKTGPLGVQTLASFHKRRGAQRIRPQRVAASVLARRRRLRLAFF